MHSGRSDAGQVACEGFAPPPSVIDRYYNTRYLRPPTRWNATDALPAGDHLHEDLYIHFHNNGSVASLAQRTALCQQLTRAADCSLSLLPACLPSCAVPALL